MGLRTLYGDIMKIYTSGYNFILGRFYGIIILGTTASTYFIVKGTEISFLETALIGLGALIFIFVSGYVYLKLDLVKAESQSNFVENPQYMEMLMRIRRIEELLNELKKKDGNWEYDY